MLLLALRQLAPACHAEAASSIYGWAGQTQRGGLEALLARERQWTSDDVGLDEVSQHPGDKKNRSFSNCACHPCAGAMLIFSVSFQV